MVNGGPGRTGSRWRRAQSACLAAGEMNLTPCCICGRPIDYRFTRTMPNHRLAATVHHIIGLSQGGDPLNPGNLAPAHRACNTAESNRIRHRLKYGARVRTSRRW